MMGVLFFLLIAHAVADFGLQSHEMAMGKNRHSVPPGYDPKVHGTKQTVWPYYLTAHALIHAGSIFVVTQSAVLAVAEFISHWVIDFGKCERAYGVHADQFFHLVMKVLYVSYLMVKAT